MTAVAEAPASAPDDEPTALTTSLGRLPKKALFITVNGTAPLITHRFDEKAKATMLATMQKQPAQKDIRDPQADFERATYWYDKDRGIAGMPCVAFKAATIGAARYFDKKVVNMTMLRGALTFIGHGPDQLVAIQGERQMREDTVRLSASSTDLRYRPMFYPWSARLTILYLPDAVTEESVVALVDAGGMGGVGEWRPGKCATGSFGTYEVVSVEARDGVVA